MRDIKDVIEQLGKVKKGSFQNDEFQNQLDHLLKEVFYTAPETMEARWEELKKIVFSNVPPHLFDWTDEDIELVSILSGCSKEFIKNDIESRKNS